MLTGKTFLSEVEAFLTRTGMKATAFGLDCVNDPNLVHDLRVGRMPSLRLVEKVSAFIEAHDTEGDQPSVNASEPASAGASE
jgi:hypothetical protein